MKQSLFFWVFVLLISPVFAEDDPFDMDFDSMFSEDSFMVDESEVVDDTVGDSLNEKSQTFSGRVRTGISYNMTREWLKGNVEPESNSFTSPVSGDFYLNARLQDGFKVYAAFNLLYYPQGVLTKVTTNMGLNLVTSNLVEVYGVESNDLVFGLSEFFVDMNIRKKVYFRFGKQVLQWGRNYFWNPTDLLNIDKKNFTDLEETREGATGLKITIPYKTLFNFYGFLDFTGAEDLGNAAAAAKAEFLLGRTEVGLSAWAKEGYLPVYGLDFSSRIGQVNLLGEMSLSEGDNSLRWNPSTLSAYQESEVWTPRVSLGFNTSFDFREVEDRILLQGEFYYNGGGADENYFDDGTMQILSYLYSGAYEVNTSAKYYGALFLNISKFFDPNLSFSANALANLVDYSTVLTASLSYSPIYDFTSTLLLIGYLGDEETEFNFYGNGMTAQLEFSFVF